MKARIYLRFAKTKRGGFKVSVHPKPNHSPLKRQSYQVDEVLPTIHMALDMEIPDEAFKPVPAGKVKLTSSEFPLPVLIYQPEDKP